MDMIVNTNRSNRYVQSWVDSIDQSDTLIQDPETAKLAPEQFNPEMPPIPPPTSSSPSKRKRSSDMQDGNSITSRPPSKTAMAFRSFPRLAQPDETSSIGSLSMSRSQSQCSTSRRSTSPIKRALDLKFLAKPVLFEDLSDNPLAQLPADVHGLYTRVMRAANKLGVIPAVTREAIEAKMPNMPLMDAWFRPETEQNRRELDAWAECDVELEERAFDKTLARRQFRALVAIKEAAAKSSNIGRGELAWNNMVHFPLLQHAVQSTSYSRRVVCEPIMNAHIAKQWLPEMGSDKGKAAKDLVAGGKMVDFALVLDLHKPRLEDEELGKAVTNLLAIQKSQSQTINQCN
ncbi:hypothetical protein MCOR09_008852 [Pyricularia oryzae]|nr:hypothetical protein MCOR09_008852 [Pyricularia oryzae]